ncbi:MAG: hypothetical protein MUE51_12225 [Thermoleophilia bacterium]|nr:hypothetical protein [Thermoleophilia bacterium]
MDWLGDNFLWMAAALAGLLVITALVYLGVRGFLLYRAVRRSRGLVMPHVEYLTAAAERAEAAVARIEQGATDRAVAQEELVRSVAELRVVSKHAGEVANQLWRPIRMLRAAGTVRR